MPVLDRELVRKRGWISMDEVLDFYTVAQITPGIVAVNIATFVGCKRNGILGGIIATVGLVLPGVCLMLFVSMFFWHFAEHRMVGHALVGIRLAVCAIMLDAVVKLFKGFFRDYKAVVIGGVAFALSVVFSVSPVFVVLGSGLAGFLLYSPRRMMPGKRPPSPEGKP